ncbi:murein biosynthesis integral membrane protein MurJ [Spirochaeta cellobiosiphila]|uniref:murein biosynthesis integral membrane protein MurJ n=1 Tax=Spirochaeta cellobiosiphila TaxID=504483 RepID=UPI0003FF86BD|nr:murein biosynthesis integral membrane protein MurJ [Spirochaeta cellobiosiphila]
MGKNRSTSRNTAIVMASTLLSRILGYVRTMILAKYFGITWIADVLNGVFNIPNNLRKLMAEGALSSAFIPSLSLAEKEDPKEAVKLTKSLLGFQLIVLIPLGLLVLFFSYPIINTLLVYDNEAKRVLASQIFKYFIWYLPLVSISAVIMAVLNVKGRFFLTSITPIIFSISVISSIIVFYKKLGPFGMVIGVLVGGVLQILIQLPVFFREKFSIIPSFNFQSPLMKKVLTNWLPIMVTSSIFTVNQLVAHNLASRLTEGSIAAFSYAIVFWQLPYGLFTNATTTVLFPKMSKEIANKEYEKAKSTMLRGLSNLISFQIPSSLYLFVAGLPLIAVSLQKGNFDLAGTILTNKVLIQFTIGLFFVGAYNFTNRYFYSQGNYFIPLKSSILVVICDVGLSIYLMHTKLGVAGLATANSISFIIGLFYLFANKGIKVSFHDVIPLLNTTVKCVVGSIVPLIGLIGFVYYLKGIWSQGSTIEGFTILAIGSLIYGLLTLTFYYLVKVDFIRELINKRRR